MKVGFGFDVDQVAKGHYAPKVYHDFIGFQVSKPVLERHSQKRIRSICLASFLAWIWQSAVTVTLFNRDSAHDQGRMAPQKT
jgi:hypothetical protein